MDKVNTVDLAVKVDEAFVSTYANSSFGEIVRDRNLVFMFKIQGRSLKPGDEYKNLGKTYQINFNQEDFDGQYFNVCHLRSYNTGLLYSKKSEIYNINVKHYAEVCYNGHMDELSETEKLFALIGVNKKSVIDRLITDSNVLKEIGVMAKKYSGDKVILESYNREELLKADMENEFEKKLASNIEANTKEVTGKNILDMARKLKSKSMDITDIMDFTGLSKEIIESL